MTTFATGREAENAAADYLKARGFQILEQNWRTRFCEIDIVAVKGRTLYFVEVKYRHGDTQGSGLEYITMRKLRQMRFAAMSWVHTHGWSGDYELSAIEVAGKEFVVTEFIESAV